MRKSLFLRMIRSRYTIMIIVFFVIAASISFYHTGSYYTDLANQLGNPTPDLNIENATEIVTQSKALTFLLQFIYVSELHDFAVFALLAFIGIFLSAQYLQDTQTGYGNIVMTRTQYVSYSREVLFAQSFYILFVVFTCYTAAFFTSLIWNGFELGSAQLGILKLNSLSAIGLLYIQFFMLGIYLVIVNGITLHFSTFIRKRYILQAIPLVIFGITILLLADTVGKLFPVIGILSRSFSPVYVGEFVDVYLSNMHLWGIPVSLGLSFTLLLILLRWLRRQNVKAFTENYLP